MYTSLQRRPNPQISASIPFLDQLTSLSPQIRALSLRELFAADPTRFAKFSAALTDELFIDYSKHPITDGWLQAMVRLLEKDGLQRKIAALFGGERLNVTENRSVWHTALRTPFPEQRQLYSVSPMIADTLERMENLVTAIHAGEKLGCTGLPFASVVHIGIGGSDLGPRMACEALHPYKHTDIDVHFVANVDGTELYSVLQKIDPTRTLFLIASKSFSTPETLLNAQSARDWFVQHLPKDCDASNAIAQHFIAISANLERVKAFGVLPAHQFPLWDFVGGRFSLWSSIGLPVALSIGFPRFRELLRGAHLVDQHFLHTPLRNNMPVLLAIIQCLHQTTFGNETEAILPYDQSLRLLPAYLQQAIMESNGKRIDQQGQVVSYPTAPIIWGDVGTNGQHAFFQLLHQGTHHVPCEFIATLQEHHTLSDHQEMLLANMVAQTRALAFGRSAQESASHPQWTTWLPVQQDLRVHKACPGGQSSTTILLTQLNPSSLGSLLALYEHRIFVQGILLNICSFDQFGVELGKLLAQEHLQELQARQPIAKYDSSTNGLMNHIQKKRKGG